jgi:eukaryotic-like serine/threonine-protein kinase
MNGADSSRLEQLLESVMQRPPAERGAFLDEACGGDSALRARLEALLTARDRDAARAGAPAAGTVVEDVPCSTAAAPSVTGEGEGTFIGRYKLLEKLGEGGFGVVWAAEQREPVRRRVALKIIKLGMDTRRVVARFEAERQALAMMDHPNIARVLDAGATDQGRPYFVMELVRGMPITKYCTQERIPTAARLELFIKVCHAIQHAHQKGIIHRDIKPSNLLVTLHDGVPVPKVIDFGIAKATQQELTDKTLYTHHSQFIGTPAYMSPEQAEMSGLDIDTRTDIYSLGVLLYELLTGSTPFDTEDLLRSGLDAMRKTIREQEPIRPSTRLAQTRLNAKPGFRNQKSEIDTDLDWIVMKCLEKDRSRRYATANGLANDIERHLAHEPVSARPPSAAYRLSKAFRRNKVVYSASLAVAIALLAGSSVSTWQAVEARRAQRQTEAARIAELEQRLAAQQAQRAAEEERERADAQARQALENHGHARRLLYVADMNLAQQSLRLNNVGRARLLLARHEPGPEEEDLRGWEWRYLWRMARSGALVTLTNRPTRGFSVAFSPDGTRLAVGWFDGRVDLWDVPGRRWLRTLSAANEVQEGRVAFSQVANWLAVTAGPGTVALHDLDTGRESVLWRAPEGSLRLVRDVTFSRDGKRAVVYAGGNAELGDEVWVVRVQTAEVESRHRTDYSDSFHHGAARLSSDGDRLYVARSDARRYRYRIQCLDLTRGVELWQTAPQRDYGLTAMDLSPDNRHLASGSGFEDPAIRIWDAATGQLLSRLEGHTAWICKLVFTEDGRRLISAAADQSIRIWNTDTWTEVDVLRGHSDEVHAVAISTRAQLLASASKDGQLLLWRADGPSREDGYRRTPAETIVDGAFPLEGSRFLLLQGRAALELPDLGPATAHDRPEPSRDASPVPELLDLKDPASPRPVPELGPSANILGAMGRTRICRWDGTDRIVVHELQESEGWVPCGAISLSSGQRPLGIATHAESATVAWACPSSPHAVYVAQLKAPDRRIALRSDVSQAVPRHFNDDGTHLLAQASVGSPVRVWNIDSGQIVVALGEVVSAATFAGRGKVLVATIVHRERHEVAFFDLDRPGSAPRRLAYPHFSRGLAASPDGRLVASSTFGGVVRLFDARQGTLVGTLHGHLNAAFGLAFSPDSRRLISASGGREAVKLWDVETQQELMTLPGTGSFLYLAAWSADGDAILVGWPGQAWCAPSWREVDSDTTPRSSIVGAGVRIAD